MLRLTQGKEAWGVRGGFYAAKTRTLLGLTDAKIEAALFPQLTTCLAAHLLVKCAPLPSARPFLVR